MIDTTSGRPLSPLSLVEENVLHALETLPNGYQVSRGTRLQFPSMPNEEFRSSYVPDFEVCDPDGQRVVVEVKSSHSLSLTNLSRFIAINKQIRESGKKFLVLVWDGERLGSRVSAMPEFNSLHIREVQTAADVVSAVKRELIDAEDQSSSRPSISI